MKKIINKMNFAIIGLMVSMPAFAAQIVVSNEMCDLIKKMAGVFKILRAAAFVGAAFFMAGWAWTYISKAGDEKAGFSIEDMKKKGISLLVGFTLLFIIGIVISFIMNAAGADGGDCLKTVW